jgi:4-hydroxy-3-methylbut-2-enyl diphosphate reductase
MKVIGISPRGYCYGVVTALEIAKGVAADPNVPRPIYVLGQLVHNHHLVERLEQLGIISLDSASNRRDLLDRIDQGTVIFTAHGVSPQVRAAARERGLHCVDATCPDVERTHRLIRNLAGDGYFVLYVGRRGHPEPEGAMGEAPGQTALIQDLADIDQLTLPETQKVAVTTQTTLSRWDTDFIVRRIRERYPQAVIFNEICRATQLRQEAAVRQSADADVVFVVGDSRSSNANRLLDVVRQQARRPAFLVDSTAEIAGSMLAGARCAAVTAGASTPSDVTRDVIRYLQDYQPSCASETDEVAG